MSDDRDRWEHRYAGDEFRVGPPSAFLIANAHRLHGRVLDVAAGAGRNALALAARGLMVDGIDIASTGLRRAQAAARGAGLRLHLIQADLTQFPLPRSCYDALINMRYLQRSLFAPMQRAVRPGGLIIFETFLIDQQQIGHPSHPDFLLQHGELRAAFGRCDILFYEEGYLQTEIGPAYLARMLARTPD